MDLDISLYIGDYECEMCGCRIDKPYNFNQYSTLCYDCYIDLKEKYGKVL